MKISRNVAAVLLILLGLCGARAADTAERPFRIMTYNIRHGCGMDKRLDLMRTAAAIRKGECQFVGLQEVDQMTSRVGGTNTCAVLAVACGLHATFARAIDHRGGEYGNAVLSEDKPKTVRRIPLPGVEPRVLLLCEFTNCWFGVMHVCSDNWKGTADIVEREVTDCAKTKPVFLVGDWNSNPTSSFLGRIRRFMEVLSPQDGTTVNDMNKCIDYIAVDAAHRDGWRLFGGVVMGDAVTSDHRPVIVKVGGIRADQGWMRRRSPMLTSEGVE